MPRGDLIQGLNSDAFCFNCERFHFYAFPPLNVISKCLQKIEKDQATGVLIVPF